MPNSLLEWLYHFISPSACTGYPVSPPIASIWFCCCFSFQSFWRLWSLIVLLHCISLTKWRMMMNIFSWGYWLLVDPHQWKVLCFFAHQFLIGIFLLFFFFLTVGFWEFFIYSRQQVINGQIYDWQIFSPSLYVAFSFSKLGLLWRISFYI